MLKKRWDKSRMPSRHVTEGLGRAPHRSNYYAMGLTEDEIAQPFVGIRIDEEAGTIDMLVDEAELATRRAAWQARPTDYNSGAIRRFAQTVGPAHLGAVTTPGAAAETHCYADI